MSGSDRDAGTAASQADAIWHPRTAPDPPAIWARRELVVSDQIVDAWLRCAAAGPYELRVNGEHVGFGLGPTLTQCPLWERFELATVLRPGANTILVEIHAPDPETPAWFRAEGEIAYAAQGRASLGTGPAWSVRVADAWQRCPVAGVAWAYASALGGTAAARARPPETSRHGRTGAEAAAQDATDWETARTLQAPAPRHWSPRGAAEIETFARRVPAFGEVDVRAPLAAALAPGSLRTCKCVRHDSVLYRARQHALVQTRSPDRGVLLLLDFERVLTGYPRLRLWSTAPGLVELGFGLQAGRVGAAIRYLAGTGRQEWTFPQAQTCRYVAVRLSGWQQPLELDCVSLVERRVLIPVSNELASPASLAAIWATGGASLSCCRQQVYRVSTAPAPPDWLALGALALNGYALHADYQTAAATLEGYPPPGTAPAALDQALAWVLAVDAHYQHSGDGDLLRRLLPDIERIARAVTESGTAAWTRDAAGPLPGTARVALSATALDAAARLARAAGREPAGDWGHLRAAAHRVLQDAWSADAGLFAAESACPRPPAELPDPGEACRLAVANALVLRHGLAQPAQIPALVQRLRKLSLAHRTPLAPGLAAFCVAGGLFAAAADRQALAALEQTWGRTAAQPGSTWSEKWGAATGEAAIGPDYYLATEILGVQPAEPGFRLLRIRPQTCGLDQAAGRLLTPRGPVAVAWRLSAEEERFTLDVELPAGGSTHLALPRLAARFPTVTLNDQTIWRNDKMHPNEYVHEVHAGESRITLVLAEHQRGAFRAVVA